jgi:hypothetical protein
MDGELNRSPAGPPDVHDAAVRASCRFSPGNSSAGGTQGNADEWADEAVLGQPDRVSAPELPEANGQGRDRERQPVTPAGSWRFSVNGRLCRVGVVRCFAVGRQCPPQFSDGKSPEWIPGSSSPCRPQSVGEEGEGV